MHKFYKKKIFSQKTICFGNKCEFSTTDSLISYNIFLKEFLRYKDHIKYYQIYLNYLTVFFEEKISFISIKFKS